MNEANRGLYIPQHVLPHNEPTNGRQWPEQSGWDLKFWSAFCARIEMQRETLMKKGSIDIQIADLPPPLLALALAGIDRRGWKTRLTPHVLTIEK